MNNKKKYMVLDVETANSTTEPIVYDIGFIITDNTGHIYEKRSYLIRDVFQYEPELMRTCYYKEKIPMYLEKLANEEITMIDFLSVRKIILSLIDIYDVDAVCAYNAHFDMNALNTTLRYVTKSEERWFFPYKSIKTYCIWHMACQAIYSQRQYVLWCLENNYVSPARNIQTNAEIGIRYLHKDLNICEEHTGLADVLIENEIMQCCFKKHKALNPNINRNCWRIPTQKYKQLIATKMLANV